MTFIQGKKIKSYYHKKIERNVSRTFDNTNGKRFN